MYVSIKEDRVVVHTFVTVSFLIMYNLMLEYQVFKLYYVVASKQWL